MEMDERMMMSVRERPDPRTKNLYENSVGLRYAINDEHNYIDAYTELQT